MTPRPTAPAPTPVRIPARARIRAVALPLLLAALLGVGRLLAPSPADAEGFDDRVLRIAASLRGTPYRWGGTTPRGFDCSGFTGYVYDRAGKALPRTSDQQAQAVRRVPRSEARPGDLVFFADHGDVHHLGIYAGRGELWHSPRTGSTVHRARIWTWRGVFFGRK